MKDTEVIFCESQKFPTWLYWLVDLSMALGALLSLFALKKELSGQSSLDTTEVLIVVFVGIGVPIAIAVLFLLLKLETQVHTDGLYIRFFPVHIHFRKFSSEDLKECYARQYKPIVEYGGWGIRYGWFGKGKVYNIRGNQGVQLVFKSGRKLLIGTQRPQELEQAIRSIMSR
jgi:hypothetical protein